MTAKWVLFRCWCHDDDKSAELESVTDPNLVYNLRAKLDALGYYDDSEVEHVVSVVLKPQVKQGELSASLGSVVDRLLKRYKDTAIMP